MSTSTQNKFNTVIRHLNAVRSHMLTVEDIYNSLLNAAGDLTEQTASKAITDLNDEIADYVELLATISHKTA